METTPSRRKRVIAWTAAALATGGLAVGAAGIANAASSGSSGSSSNSASSVSASDNTGSSSASGSAVAAATPAPVDPATMPNGPGETLLTGDAASQVTAAALAAEPGATIIRVETDSSGHAYEAHIKTASGATRTLYFTSSYAADGSDDGFGGPPPGGRDHGQAPAASTSGSTSTSDSTATTTG